MTRPLRRPGEPSARREDVAFLIPLFGVVLLMPPIVTLFATGEPRPGPPLEVIYLFGVWIALILGAVALARHRSFRTGQADAGLERPEPGQPSEGG